MRDGKSGGEWASRDGKRARENKRPRMRERIVTERREGGRNGGRKTNHLDYKEYE